MGLPVCKVLWVDGSSSTRWEVFLGTTSCCGTAWPVSLGFSGLFDDFAFFGVLAVDIEALLEGFRRRFCGLMTIDDQVAMDFHFPVKMLRFAKCHCINKIV
jgi:hypothetical protein